MGIFDFLKKSKINLTYHDNGEIKTSKRTLSNKRHGSQKTYFDNGQLKNDINFTNGVQDDGDVISFYKWGSKARKITLIKGKYQGDLREWYPNGKLKIKGTYNEDKYHGELKEWYSSGKLKKKGIYSNGKPQKTIESWYENENIFRVEKFKTGSYNPDESKEYYDNGNIKFIKTGDKYQFYDNENNLKCEITSKGGYYPKGFNGLWKEYRKNGSIKYDLDFENKDSIHKMDEGKVLKTNYTLDGDFFSKELISYSKVFYNEIQYHLLYAENRLYDKIYTIPYAKGIKGPPGINRDAGKKIKIKPVTSIEDIITLN
jgi:antitoxin component YwqK of YwqJK toxin-antitoxin module